MWLKGENMRIRELVDILRKLNPGVDINAYTALGKEAGDKDDVGIIMTPAHPSTIVYPESFYYKLGMVTNKGKVENKNLTQFIIANKDWQIWCR